MTNVRTMNFQIAANKTFTLKQNIKRLNKKAAVARAGKFTVVIGDNETRRFQIMENGRPTEVTVCVTNVTVTGPDFALGNYDLIALVKLCDSTEGMTRQYVDFMPSDFDGYDDVDTHCDHCNTNRARTDIFVLRDIETGSFMQVGKSCLKDFTGYTPADAIKGAGAWSNLKDYADNLGGMAYARSLDTKPLDVVVALAVKEIEANGYVNRETATDRWIPSTGDNVQAAAFNKHTPIETTEEQRAKAADVIAWAATRYTATDNAFEMNIANLIAAGRVPSNMVGFAACLPAMKSREEERAAREAVTANSDYFGEIKKRMTANIEVIGKQFIETQFGGSTLYTFLVDGKNVAKWFASGSLDLEVGATETVKMTVKKHEEFRGTKQTMVNRVAIA